MVSDSLVLSFSIPCTVMLQVAVLDTKAWLVEVGGKQMIKANATYLR